MFACVVYSQPVGTVYVLCQLALSPLGWWLYCQTVTLVGTVVPCKKHKTNLLWEICSSSLRYLDCMLKLQVQMLVLVWGLKLRFQVLGLGCIFVDSWFRFQFMDSRL